MAKFFHPCSKKEGTTKERKEERKKEKKRKRKEPLFSYTAIFFFRYIAAVRRRIAFLIVVFCCMFLTYVSFPCFSLFLNMPGGTTNSRCQSCCPTCIEMTKTLATLDSVTAKLERVLHQYPHYTKLVKEVCLDGWASEVSEILAQLERSEKIRDEALLREHSDSLKKNCRQDTANPAKK